MAQSWPIAITAIGRAASEIPTDKRATAYLAKRGISAETAALMHVHTGRRLAGGGGVVPDPTGDILCFPLIDDGKIVNCKYQGPSPERKRGLVKGAPLIFYGLDNAVSMHRTYPRAPLVITEGEIDCLTALDAGQIAISVPNGAVDGEDPVEYDPPSDDDKGFRYLQHSLDFVGSFGEVIIATDGDRPGVRLREELGRRIGRARSRFIDYPEGAKDLNEVLLAKGADAVFDLVAGAKQFPLRGLHRFSDYADELPIIPNLTGIPRLDELLRPHLGALMIVTGVPAHGKSTFVMDLAASMSRLHNWPIAIASFEMKSRRIQDALTAAHANDPLTVHGRGTARFAMAERWAQEQVTIIDPRDWDVSVTIDWLCQRIVEAVRRNGIRIAVLDPWGDIHHPMSNHGQVTTDYISEAIRKFRRVCLDLDLLGILVAHPVKMSKDGEGGYVMPTLYDIAGSAHFFNKTDYGLTVYRSKLLHEAAVIAIEKIRYQPETGHPGEVTLDYNPVTGKYR